MKYGKIKRLSTFEKIVGYATIIGTVATVYGVKKIYNLTVELKPVINIIQKEQSNLRSKYIRDTIPVIYKETVIYRDTVVLVKKDTIYSKQNEAFFDPIDKEKDNIRNNEQSFRYRHNLP